MLSEQVDLMSLQVSKTSPSLNSEAVSTEIELAVPLKFDQFNQIISPIVREAMKKDLYLNWTNIAV